MGALAAEITAILDLNSAERQIIECIAKETNASLIEVAKLYHFNRALLDCATIRSYVPIIAARQVRMQLKQSKS